MALLALAGPIADAGAALQAPPPATMKEFPHPFAWAAFGLIGGGR